MDVADLIAAFDEARDAGDAAAMERAALEFPTVQRFGVYPGRLPAMLHEAYVAASAADSRARLAAALARSWVYGGDAARAIRFADESLQLARELGREDVLADALDASLLAHWGPDDFGERVSLAARLDELAGHLPDWSARLSAHLWRLTTAWECLDVVAVHRQLRALDVVASESGSLRAAFFAASRRAMYALAVDDLDLADGLMAQTASVGAQLGEPDLEAVLHELRAARALAAGDAVTLADEAEAHEAFGTAEGIASISAVGAVLWLEAGHTERAEQLAVQLLGGGVALIARDVDFLLTVSCATWVAAAAGLDSVLRDCATALAPYAGRAVINAGAVSFHGVVDDYLFRAWSTLGDGRADGPRRAAVTSYQRVGARWWQRNLVATSPTKRPMATRFVHLQQEADGRWTVGEPDQTFTLPDRKGLHYLRYLVERPLVEVDALALSDAASGHAGRTVKEANTGETVDAAALDAYRRRVAELGALLDRADASGDQLLAIRLTAERDALLHEIRAATGLGGRPRRAGGSAERARIAVQKAITTALAQIELHDAHLARMLRDNLRTGASCVYDPSPAQPVTWVTATN